MFSLLACVFRFTLHKPYRSFQVALGSSSRKDNNWYQKIDPVTNNCGGFLKTLEVTLGILNNLLKT